MSEEAVQAASAAEQAHRYSGGVGVGEAGNRTLVGAIADAAATSAIFTEAERDHNAQMFGVTYRERTRNRPHTKCIVLCLAPEPRRVNRCPSCYGDAVPMDIYAARLDPMPGFAQRAGRWAGEWVAAFLDAVTLPFRRDREHSRALVVDVLQDAMAAGLAAELPALDDISGCIREIESQLLAIRNLLERDK